MSGLQKIRDVEKVPDSVWRLAQYGGKQGGARKCVFFSFPLSTSVSLFLSILFSLSAFLHPLRLSTPHSFLLPILPSLSLPSIPTLRLFFLPSLPLSPFPCAYAPPTSLLPPYPPDLPPRQPWTSCARNWWRWRAAGARQPVTDLWARAAAQTCEPWVQAWAGMSGRGRPLLRAAEESRATPALMKRRQMEVCRRARTLLCVCVHIFVCA